MTSSRHHERPSGERIEFYRSHGDWRWRYFAANGEETDASTEAYERRLYALGQAMQRHPDVPVFEASVATEPDGEPKHWIELQMLWRLVCRWLRWSPEWGVDRLASPPSDAWARFKLSSAGREALSHEGVVNLHFPDQHH